MRCDSSCAPQAVRFSLVSASPIPLSMRQKTRKDFGDACGEYSESTPRAIALDTLSLLAVDSPVCPTHLPEILAPCVSYLHEHGINCALTYGDMALYGPRMIVTDVDSTFITEEVIELLAEVAGSEDMVREVTNRAMHGELDFVESLAQRVATLAGLPASAFEEIAAGITLTEGADRLVRTAHDNGARFALVSGGFHEVADLVANPLGVDAILANRLDVRDGVLTGKTIGTVVDREVKKSAVEDWARDFDVPLGRVVAAGDGANDLGMMSVAGLSLAFCAKPVVREHADSFISFPHLDAIAALVGWDITE